MRGKPPQIPPGSGRPQNPFNMTPMGTNRPGFWERMQQHFDDDPKWDGTFVQQAGAGVQSNETLVRVSNLPISVSICVVLTATIGNNPGGGPAPPPAVPWFIVSFGTEGSKYRYSAFAGIEIGGGTGVIVETVPIGVVPAPVTLRANAWICTAPPVMNVVQVL